MDRPIKRRDFLKAAAALPFIAAAPMFAKGLAPAPTAQSGRPNVLMIVLDTLSANHMSAYGYPRQTTPNLARFADRAIVFNRHYSGGNFTSPGTASLLTGAHTWTQRAFSFQGTVTQDFERRSIFRVLSEAGYRCIAYTHNWLVVQLFEQFQGDIQYWKPLRELTLSDTQFSDKLFPKDHGVAIAIERMMDVRSGTFGTGSLFLSMLHKAMDTRVDDAVIAKYGALFPRGLPSMESIHFTLEDAVDWMESEVMQSPQPYFAYIHLFPPHAPYNPRHEFIGRFDGDEYNEVEKPPHPLGWSFGKPAVFRRQYDEYIAYADAEFGRLYDFLIKSGVTDNTYVIFTSDHGEMLERSVRGHLNPLLYDAITRVPLIISRPGQSTREDVHIPTSCVDVLPTLAYIAGREIPAWAEGQILPKLGGEAQSGRDVFVIEAKSNAKSAPLSKATIAMIRDQYKLIHYVGYDQGYEDKYELYDIGQDPEELNDLSSDPTVASDLERALTAKLDEVNRPYQRI